MADNNLFTSYLLKLQETHLQMVKKLKEEVDELTKKCQKTQTFANQNAYFAKKYHTKCKLLLNDRETMKTKMKEIMKDRLCKRCKAIKEQQKNHLETSSVTKSPTPVLPSTSGSCNPSHDRKSKSKLSRKKGIMTEEAADVTMSRSPVMSNFRDENLKKSFHGRSSTVEKNIDDGKTKFNVSDCAIDARGDQEMIFVPETFEPDLSLNFSYDDNIPVLDGSDIRTPNVKGINETKNWIIGVEKHAISIPDTCAFQDDDVTMLNTQDTLLKAPQFCSTQIVPQLHDALPKLNTDQSLQVGDDDLTMIHTQDTLLKAPQFCSTPTIPKIKKILPLININQAMKQETEVENHVVRQHAHRRSSLPKSESQYPVDLANTQIPSPTFQRDVSPALSKEDQGKTRQSVSKNLSFFAQKTPTLGGQKGNESHLSDTSPLLLRESKSDSKTDSKRTAFMDKSCDQGSEDLKGISANSKKRKHADVDKSNDENVTSFFASKALESIGKLIIKQQECVKPQQSHSNSPTGHKLVQKTLTMFKGGNINSSDTHNDVYLKRAIEESLQELEKHRTSEFKKPFMPAHKRTRCQGDNDFKGIYQSSGDDSFLNGTIDPAIDLSDLEENTPHMKELADQISTSFPDQKPTSVVMTSGMVCIVKEVPCIQDKQENLSTAEVDEDENLSHDDMFAADEEPEADVSSKQVSHEPDTSNEVSDEVSDEKPMKLPGDSFFKNFDDLPPAEEEPQYKYVEVVRKQADRRKLRGFECKDCQAYFSTMDLTDSQKADRMKSCSRHRAKYSPPSTQPHYWDVDFPDTETSLRRGYMNNAPQIEEQEDSRKRLSRRYKQLFKSNAASTSKQEH